MPLLQNDLNLRENGPVCKTYFHMNVFALTLVLIQRQNSEMAYLNVTYSCSEKGCLTLSKVIMGNDGFALD